MKYVFSVFLGVMLSAGIANAGVVVNGVEVPAKVFQQCAGSNNFYNCVEQLMRSRG